MEVGAYCPCVMKPTHHSTQMFLLCRQVTILNAIYLAGRRMPFSGSCRRAPPAWTERLSTKRKGEENDRTEENRRGQR